MIIVVGGHSRKIGKSSAVAALIAGIPGARWLALKITTHKQHEPVDEPYVLTEEMEATATDSGRYLAAGAERSFLLRASAGQLEEAISRMAVIIDSAANVIIESNRVIEILRPDLFLLVVDPSIDDWKESARRNLPLADAILLVKKEPASARVAALPLDVPWFLIEPPAYTSPELLNLVIRRLETASGVD